MDVLHQDVPSGFADAPRSKQGPNLSKPEALSPGVLLLRPQTLPSGVFDAIGAILEIALTESRDLMLRPSPS